MMNAGAGQSEIEFRIRENGTSKPIPNATILIEFNSGKSLKLHAGKSGISKCSIPAGQDYQCLVYSQGFELQVEDLEIEKELSGKKEVIFIHLEREKNHPE